MGGMTGGNPDAMGNAFGGGDTGYIPPSQFGGGGGGGGGILSRLFGGGPDAVGNPTGGGDTGFDPRGLPIPDLFPDIPDGGDGPLFDRENLYGGKQDEEGMTKEERRAKKFREGLFAFGKTLTEQDEEARQAADAQQEALRRATQGSAERNSFVGGAGREAGYGPAEALTPFQGYPTPLPGGPNMGQNPAEYQQSLLELIRQRQPRGLFGRP